MTHYPTMMLGWRPHTWWRLARTLSATEVAASAIKKWPTTTTFPPILESDMERVTMTNYTTINNNKKGPTNG